MAFLVFFLCLFSLVALLNREEPADVARVAEPEVGSQPVPPVSGEGLEERLLELAVVHPGDFGVVVFDPRSGESVEINADRPVEAASLAKLPVLLALYKEAAAGDLSLEEEMEIEAFDRQYYGSGVLHSYPVGHELTLRECARMMIKESDNTAWVMLERRLGKERISRELDSLGAEGSDYATYRMTPEDVLLVLRAISDPGYTNPQLSSEMLDIMTGSAYEDRIPDPLPHNVEVAHKVGSLQGVYSDAGIVFDGGSRSAGDGYFVVVVVRGTTEGAARGAIRDMSLATYEALGSGETG